MRPICVVAASASRLRINGCVRCDARPVHWGPRGATAGGAPGSPNLTTSPLIGPLPVVRQHLFQQLVDVNAVFDRGVELEANVRRELEVLEPASKLGADETFCRDKPG